MAVSNQLSESRQQPKFSAAIQTEKYQKLIYNTLGEKRAIRFIASISSAVANNEKLQECDAGTILCAALLGESLNLSPSPQLGQYYLIPYDKKDKEGNVIMKVAQFQLGYKGYLQLAIRSGYYKKINILPIKFGELEYFNPLEEEIKIHMIEDEQIREKADTIGYYAMFEYLNGFKKTIYWSKKKMDTHANTYSNSFKYNKTSSYWYKNFDAMACKTMLRQLISKWGIMSIDLQKAYEKDMSIVHENGQVEYFDNPEQAPIEVEAEESKPEEQKPVMEYVEESQQKISDDEFFAGT